MRNNNYIEPEIEVIMFNTNDIVTVSGDNPIGGGGIELPDDEWK